MTTANTTTTFTTAADASRIQSLYIATVGLAQYLRDRNFGELRGLHLMTSVGCIDIWDEKDQDYLTARIAVELRGERICVARRGDWSGLQSLARFIDESSLGQI